LFLVGLDGRGRSEWDATVRALDEAEKLQAAILADRWGWHSRAISTAASLGQYDDLAIRYPLPWKQQFESFASAAKISPTWAYGIARSESLFMRDVRSSAGAVGLMQLMPATGRQVASEIRLPYAGLATLTDPESNIRLGTSYLGHRYWPRPPTTPGRIALTVGCRNRAAKMPGSGSRIFRSMKRASTSSA